MLQSHARSPQAVLGPVIATVGTVVGALAGTTGAVAATWWLAAGPVLRLACALPAGPRSARPTVDDAVLGGCGLALLGCLAWLLLAVTAAATSLLAARLSPEGPFAGWLDGVAERTCPAVLRRAVALALGAALSAGAGAAHAAPPQDGRHGPHDDLRGRLSGLALPDRVTGGGAPAVAHATVLRAQPAAAGRAAGRAEDRAEDPAAVTVRPGDSLWSIAAELLGPGAGDVQVARAWHRIASVNAGRLGPDPDLILPGTRLSVPDLPRPRP